MLFVCFCAAQGLDQVAGSAALLTALDRLCEEPQPHPEQQQQGPPGRGEQPTRGSQQGAPRSLQRQALSTRATIRALVAVMKR